MIKHALIITGTLKYPVCIHSGGNELDQGSRLSPF